VGPVEGATVTYTSEADECLPKGTLATNDQGKGAHKVGSGKHFVVVQADGYAIHRQSLSVSAGENQLVEVELKPTKIKLEAKKIVILEKVYFETAKAIIKPVSFELLDEVATTLVANPQIGKVEVSGHTDSRGSDSYNLQLSDDRAKAVLEYLTNRGVKPERLVAQGYGETLPIASNRTDSGRAQNRRVEFTILGEHASRAALQAAEGGESNE
jgi:outer membrane protein OmpA-like peptidoglycan-associated protein